MEIVYANKKVKEQCTSVKAARKLFGGDATMAVKLHSRVNALKQAPTLKDIVVQRQYRFHKLTNKDGKDLEGYFAIDVKTRRDPRRLIIRPLDSNGEPFESSGIDAIADAVEVIGIKEVSRHYE